MASVVFNAREFLSMMGEILKGTRIIFLTAAYPLASVIIDCEQMV
jgi:hypothetical protein